uniref:Uncharacterized protein n=1 Tax=Lactuca sativa TaxID=4236 RepID=A0A9R1ULE1_LACSA|nr:hypothetical protein LSAT_V11C800443120 [Lactuca sativa]
MVNLDSISTGLLQRSAGSDGASKSFMTLLYWLYDGINLDYGSKKVKKPARKLILQSSSDSDSEYVPTGHQPIIRSESESESSDDEDSVRGGSPPRPPMPEVSVCSQAPSPPPFSIPISLPHNFPIITSQPSSTIPIPTPIFFEATTTITGCCSAKCQHVKHQASVSERLNELQGYLALESRVMDELALKTTQLKTQTLKLNQANKELEALRSERSVVKSSVGNVHSILLHLLEAYDSVLTILVRHHLAEKLRPALDILSRIEGVTESVVSPQHGGEEKKTSS